MNPETPSRLNPTFSGQAPITPTGFLRAIRFPLLALVLAGALLSMAIPASAAPSQQTVTTLVSNTGQATTGFSTLASSSPVHAQGFKTGPNPSGYTLTSIGFEFNTIADTSTAATELTLTLHANNLGAPGDELCELTDPATFASSGVNHFNAPSSGTTCPALAPTTTYFAALTRANNNATKIQIKDTSLSSEDGSSATGWTIRDQRHYQATTSQWLQNSSRSNLIDVKGFAIAHVTVSESAVAVTEGGATDTYTVVLDTAPTGDVTIAVSETSDDITVSPTTLTFGTSNWNTAQPVTVTAVDDSIDEDEETVTISHSVSTTADTPNYPTTLAIDGVEVTVTDNDTTGVTVSKTSVSVSEGGTTDTYTVVLDTAPTGGRDHCRLRDQRRHQPSARQP